MSPVPSAHLPYIGLRPFDEQDEPLFFGREEQVASALHQLEDHPFLAVVGPSGSGKSSIVRAGLLPAVRHGFLLGTTSWRIVVVRPGHQPYERLARGLERAERFPEPQFLQSAEADDDPPQQAAILAALRSGDQGVLLGLDQCGIASDVRVLIVIDQFEELFAFRREGRRGDVAARDEASGFVRTLLRGCAAAPDRVRVVITMRSDFIGDAEAFLGLPEAISQSQFLVPRLNRHQMEEVIVRPASVTSAGYRPFTFEPDLVNRIINDAGDRSDQLPLMQHALMRTWKQAVERAGAAPGRLIVQHSDYARAGCIENAISNHADAAWTQIEQEAGLADITKQVFLLLCDVSPDGQITRRRPPISEIRSVTGAGVEDIRRVLEIFQEDDRNFLLPPCDTRLTDDVTLDISHESLIRQWKRFHDWVQHESVSAAQLQRLRETALRWPAREPLLRDPALTVALDWWRDEAPSPAWADRYGGGLDRVQAFLTASDEARRLELEAAEAAGRKELEEAQQRAAEQATNIRRFRRATIALAVLTLAALGAALYAVRQRDRVQTLLVDLAGTEVTRNKLRDEVKQLEASRGEMEASKKDAEQQLGELGNRSRALELEQKNLQTFNTALADIGGAWGTVQPQPGGTFAVAFQEGKPSPDKVLPALSRLGRVAAVDLSGTTVTDAGLRGLVHVKDLTSLDLSSTNISDAGVARLAGLSRLRELSLSDSLITEASLPHLEKLVNLRSLNLSRTRVNRKGIAQLRSKLPQLSVTYIADPFLDALSSSGGDVDEALAAVKGHRSGKTIEFNGTDITNATLRLLGEYERIVLVDSKSLTNDGLKILSRNKVLKALALHDNTQITDQGIENLSIPTLTHLDLDGLAMTNRALAMIGKFTGLQSLRISGTEHEITDAGVAALVNLKNLREFALEFTYTTGVGTVETLARMPALEKISLMSNTRIPGDAYRALKDLPRLRVLDLRYNPLTDDTVDALKTLTQLDVMRVSNTKLSEAGLASLRQTIKSVDSEGSDNVAEITVSPSVEPFEPSAVRELSTGGRVLTAGLPIVGQLGTTPRLRAKPVQAWSLRGCEKKWVLVELRSTDFDAMLAVAGLKAFFEVDDDGGGGLDARVAFPCEETEYKVVVSSADDQVGAFRLSATLSDGPPAPPSLDAATSDNSRIEAVRNLPTEGRVVSPGSPVTGQLQPTPTIKGSPAQAWTLKGCEKKRVRIDLISTEFDPLLIVLDPKSSVLLVDDDAGGKLDARLEITCNSPEYTVVVSTADNDVGAFQLSVVVIGETTSPPRAAPSRLATLEFWR